MPLPTKTLAPGLFPPALRDFMKIRVSLVDYLNSAPLGWAFLHGPLRDRVEVLPASPARCAEQLASGEVDVGLIPSVEYQRIPALAVIPGIAVAASGPVRSVLLVRRKEAGEIRSVALDTSSRTSVVLVRLLLENRLGLRPELVPHAPDLEAMLARHSAALLIGDAALRLSPLDYTILDLAEAWIEWQGRPFVFAFWACRPRALTLPDLVELFLEAREWGLGRREEIAADYARRLDLDPAFLFRYLHENIDYDLGPQHIEGLESFYRLSAQAGLTPASAPVRFVPREVGIGSPTG